MKYSIDSLVQTSAGEIGFVSDFEMNEDHEKYFVSTGNAFSTHWYDVTEISLFLPVWHEESLMGMAI